MTKPITPREAKQARQDSIPEFVFEVVNNLIVESLSSGTCATIKQDTIRDAIHAHPDYKQLGKPHPSIFDLGWMDFEDHYRKAGWKVEYDKPGFNETYPATFTFRAKR